METKTIICSGCNGTGRDDLGACQECEGKGGYEIERCPNCHYGLVEEGVDGEGEVMCPDCSGTGWLHPWMKRRLQNMREMQEEDIELRRVERIETLKQRIKSLGHLVKELEADEYIVKIPWCERDDGQVHEKYSALKDNLYLRENAARQVIEMKKELEGLYNEQ